MQQSFPIHRSLLLFVSFRFVSFIHFGNFYFSFLSYLFALYIRYYLLLYSCDKSILSRLHIYLNGKEIKKIRNHFVFSYSNNIFMNDVVRENRKEQELFDVFILDFLYNFMGIVFLFGISIILEICHMKDTA